MSHVPHRKMHSLSLLATENCHGGNLRFRLTYERGTAPHPPTNGRSPRVPGHFDRFAPANGKLSGRIVLGKDFDSVLGTGMKLYMNMGSNQGVKVGDYFRVVRSYTATLRDPVDSLSFKARTSEDTQMRPPAFEANRFTKTKGPNIHVGDLPRRAVGEVVVLNVTPTSSSAMVVFALEDVYAGDSVELDEQQ